MQSLVCLAMQLIEQVGGLKLLLGLNVETFELKEALISGRKDRVQLKYLISIICMAVFNVEPT